MWLSNLYIGSRQFIETCCPERYKVLFGENQTQEPLLQSQHWGIQTDGDLDCAHHVIVSIPFETKPTRLQLEAMRAFPVHGD